MITSIANIERDYLEHWPWLLRMPGMLIQNTGRDHLEYWTWSLRTLDRTSLEYKTWSYGTLYFVFKDMII